VKILRQWSREGQISEVVKRKIYPRSWEVPKLYGLPKIHKKDYPLRPIVSSIGSVSYKAARLVADILSPLVGQSPHHIKNSADFVKKIKDLEVPPGQKQISYDVSALFTSIPVDSAVDCIKRRLEQDDTLHKRTELKTTQILQLLEFCLNTTYFVYDGQFFKQTHGAAMGSPVSPIVANLYMEDFESWALRTAPNPPHLWYRYVDDTFVLIHEYFISEFTAHINSIDPNIKFTTEPEVDFKLPFLDTCIKISEDATTTVEVYRKATHTDQYLNFNSNHHLEHKRSVVRTLLHRANNLVTTPEDRAKETEHVKAVLRDNGYKPWIFKLPTPKSKEKPEDSTSGAKAVFPVCLPYVRGLSEKLTHIFRQHGVSTYHKPFNTIHQSFVTVSEGQVT